MARDHWTIDCGRNEYSWYIGWYIAEEGDIGAHFGSGLAANDGRMHYDPDDPWEIAHNMVCDEVKALGLGALRNGRWEFESEKDAKAVLRLLNSAMKRAKDKKPWPEWALKAQAAGWKPPKGWKP